MSFTIENATEPVYVERSDDRSHVVQVYGSVVAVMKRDAAAASGAAATSLTWTIGDLVVFTTNESSVTDPEDRDTRVGHILALFVARRAGEPEATWWAVVRHLLPWGAASQVLKVGEINQIRSHCRAKQQFGLLLTFETSTIALSRIDPAISIAFDPSAAFATGGGSGRALPCVVGKGCWTLDQVYGMRDRDEQLTLFAPAANEWSNEGYKVNYDDVLPVPLRRGWKACLRGLKELKKKLKSGLLSSLRATGRLQPCPPGLAPPEPEDLEGPDDEGLALSLWELASRAAQAPSREPSPQPRGGTKRPARRKLSSSTGAAAKRRRKASSRGANARRPTHALKAPRDDREDEDAVEDIQRPSSPEQGAAVGQSRSKHSRKASSCENTGSPSAQKSSEPVGENGRHDQTSVDSVQSLSPPVQDAGTGVQPLSAPAYVLRTSKSVKVPHPLSFHTQVQVATEAPNPRARGKGPAPEPLRWTLNIGDVVIVAWNGKVGPSASSPSYRPFTVRWFVAQVLSIYQRHENGESDGGVRDSADDRQDKDHAHLGDEEHRNKDASVGDGTWWMELRWFYRPEELPKLGVAPPNESHPDFALVEVDELVSTAPVQWVLGRARVTSSSHDRLGVSTDEDGVLNVTFLCQHIFLQQYDEKAVRPIHDWDIRGRRLAGPLSRALLCEKAWPGSLRHGANRLKKIYTKFLIQHFRLTDTKLEPGVAIAAAAHDDKVRSTNLTSWPSGLLEDVPIVDEANQRVLGRSSGREFLPTILIPTWPRRYEARATATKSCTFRPCKVTVGDCVCLADAGSHVPPPTKESKNPWYPFRGPWRPAQVVSIYRDLGSQNSSNILLEVRLFLRPDELSSPLLSLLPPLLEGEVFETEIIEQDVPAYRVLGHCDVRGSHSQQPAEVASTSQLPVTRRRSRFVFLQGLKRFLPLFCKTTGGWKRSMIQRGLRCSRFTQNGGSLKSGVEVALNMKQTWDDDMQEAFFPVLQTHRAHPLSANLYSTVPLSPKWDSFHRSDLLCPESERPGLNWVVHIGDLVAARAGNDEGNNWFPFLVPWKPCQVLSIWSDSSSNEPRKATIRWLPCLHPGKESDDLPKMREEVEAFESPEVCVLDVDDFLGYVSLRVDSTRSSLSFSAPAFLPPALIDFVSSSNRPLDEALRASLLKGLNVCAEYDDATRGHVVRLLGSENVRTDQGESREQSSNENITTSTNIKRVEAVGAPIFFEASSGIQFYRSLDVATRFDALTQRLTKARRDELPGSWSAKLGDVVAVQTAARPGKKADMAPFTVPWRVAEVVTIFEQHLESSGAAISCVDSLQVEVRWFYRPQELSSCRRSNPAASADTKEIFESDSYAVVSASSLLWHVLLRDKVESSLAQADLMEEGMPFIPFTCREFWSSRSKSLMPIGNLKSRIGRGRSHSRYFSKYEALQKACERSERISSSGLLGSASLSVKGAFQRVIDKLSLTDASKEAMHRSAGIIGREAERSFISDFLLHAVKGSTEEGSSSTLFVAGPPGAGKTACVRACINELRRTASSAEQNVGDFDLVLVNGMELRHPKDAYTRLWEEVSPDKERCSAATAASRLEAYFTSVPSNDKCREKGGLVNNAERGRVSVTVVLVDELDYLVTKKETILYDLFDWPSRSFHGRRLVVIGISNTLNLPEQLHPRLRSRIGSKKCLFNSYTHEEISKIVRAKVAQASPDYEVFEEGAITLVAKKTAAASGDVRQALRMCRAAAEMRLANIDCGTQEVVPGASLRVGLPDVAQVCRDSSAQVKGVTLSSPFEALFLVALASLSKWTGRERGVFDLEEILTKMNAMAKSLGDERYLPPPSLDETLSIMSRLREAHVIGLSTSKSCSTSHRPGVSGSGGPWPLVFMVIEDSTILVAMKNSDNQELAMRYLQQCNTT